MKDLQAISDLLDQKWDPIGVYEGPRDERFPPGEYISYAGWIFQSLRKGGGKADVVELMRQAREYMGLGAAEALDDLVADAIVETVDPARTLGSRCEVERRRRSAISSAGRWRRLGR
jgi:hypothetical protein